jgi:hypothetical protein
MKRIDLHDVRKSAEYQELSKNHDIDDMEDLLSQLKWNSDDNHMTKLCKIVFGESTDSINFKNEYPNRHVINMKVINQKAHVDGYGNVVLER